MQADAVDPSPLAGLLVVCAIMFVGALFAGFLPYFIAIPEARLQSASALGGGLLIGSALAVVIPEGFRSFAEAAGGAVQSGDDAHVAHAAHHGGHLGGEELPHGLTGLALVGGFLAMLLLDQLQAAAGGGHAHAHAHAHATRGAEGKGAAKQATRQGLRSRSRSPSGPGRQAAEELSRTTAGLEAGGVQAAATARAAAAAAGAAAPLAAPDRAIAGLLVHCGADGLAMGAAALSGNAALSLVVGTAMVLHKAPMSFGLATYLISCGWGWARAQTTLIIFSTAAPASALATYALLGAVPLFTTPAAVALAMLFSGGTFLHAATMHILPEVLSARGCSGGGGGGMGREQLAAVAVGCMLPVALSWGHSH